jgi:plasmid stabilization system protein ParE
MEYGGKSRALLRPERAGLAPEGYSFYEPIRELFFGRGNRGTYRILIAVLAKTIFVLHVRHGSMQALEP